MHDVHKSFGTIRAVRGVSFELPSGQVAGLLGHNGAGKTTTIRLVAGYLMPDSGSVQIEGLDTLRQRSQAMRRLGYLPESTPLYNEMVVSEYLHFRGRLCGMDARARRTRVEHVVERCWLKEVRSRRIATLSKGFRQRVGLASALLHDPRVLLLDEPTNGLDPTQIHETRELIRALGRERTMLVSSHILPEVERLCDRVIILAGGKVCADGAPGALTAASGSGGYILSTRARPEADEAGLGQALRRIAGVSSAVASTIGGLTTWRVSASAGTGDLREAIGMEAVRAGAAIVELRAEAATLEAVFRGVMEAAAHEEANAT